MGDVVNKVPQQHQSKHTNQAIEAGGKPDPLGHYASIFPRLVSLKTWDLEDGDAQFMKGVADNKFDFLHSNHCLEHMVDASEALDNWIRK